MRNQTETLIREISFDTFPLHAARISYWGFPRQEIAVLNYACRPGQNWMFCLQLIAVQGRVNFAIHEILSDSRGVSLLGTEIELLKALQSINFESLDDLRSVVDILADQPEDSTNVIEGVKGFGEELVLVLAQRWDELVFGAEHLESGDRPLSVVRDPENEDILQVARSANSASARHVVFSIHSELSRAGAISVLRRFVPAEFRELVFDQSCQDILADYYVEIDECRSKAEVLALKSRFAVQFAGIYIESLRIWAQEWLRKAIGSWFTAVGGIVVLDYLRRLWGK